MSVAAPSDRFLECLRKSGLVEESSLHAWLEQLTASDGPPLDASALATALVCDGFLTSFQAQNLLAGKSRGYLINEKYRILEMLGSGSAGRVFLCEHVMMRRLFAVKILSEQASRRKEAMERFYREARASGLLDHPNMVRCFDVDHKGAMHFLVIEYVDGVNLYDYVQNSGPLTVDQAANYIAQAASGLQYAFEAGLVHRDIKPSNLLVDRAGVVKILDMGLARFFHDVNGSITRETDREELLGTIDYIAPEQALDSHDVDVRADIYSLGATFYYLLTGRGPFLGSTAEKLMRHQVARPHPIRDVRPDVPEEIEEIVFKMMAKSPAERYQTPAEVEDALSQWLGALQAPAEEQMPRHCALIERLIKQSASTQGTLSNIAGVTLKPRGSSKVSLPAARGVGVAAPASAPPLTESPPPRSWQEWLLGAALVTGCLAAGLYFGGAFSNRSVQPVDAAATPVAVQPAPNH